MKEQNSIPTTKVQRAGKFITTGAKIGRNYLKHYGKKLVDPTTTREQLHEDNATDIYDSLSKLKGSALKVAQMLSMDKNLLPKAYQQQFSMAQYSAPPLSYPLVVKTFQTYFGKAPVQKHLDIEFSPQGFVPSALRDAPGPSMQHCSPDVKMYQKSEQGLCQNKFERF